MLETDHVQAGLTFLLFIVVLAVVLAYSYVRSRSLQPSWAWNEIAIQFAVGGRLEELFVAEVQSVHVVGGQLVFDTTRGSTPIERRWVVQPFVRALAIACGLTEREVERALGSSSPVQLWRGGAGAFRLPTMPTT